MTAPDDAIDSMAVRKHVKKATTFVGLTFLGNWSLAAVVHRIGRTLPDAGRTCVWRDLHVRPHGRGDPAPERNLQAACHGTAGRVIPAQSMVPDRLVAAAGGCTGHVWSQSAAARR